MNRNKRNRYKSLILAIIKHEQLILAQGEDSKKGQLIFLMRKGSFQVILYKMIRFLSGKLKKHTKLAKIVKISEIFNRLVFPLNFNRFRHPMTEIIFLFLINQVFPLYTKVSSSNLIRAKFPIRKDLRSV